MLMVRQVIEGQEKWLLMQLRLSREWKESIVQPALRCKHWFGPHITLDFICMDVGLRCTQTIVLSSGFTVLRNQRDKLPIGWSS